MIKLPEGPFVPPEYVGVWKRTLLRTPTREDMTTQVYWLQTRCWHADIRVPGNRPDTSGKSSLDELSRPDLMGLARQQGFCGTTVVDGNICRWLRRHDFQPPTGANDIGRMEFDTPDRVFEYGVEADYFEIWERLPQSKGRASAIQVADDPVSFFLTAGDYVMYVRPRVPALAISPSLAALLESRNNQVVRETVDFEISFGRRTTPDHWRIELSTLPWKQGLIAASRG